MIKLYSPDAMETFERGCSTCAIKDGTCPIYKHVTRTNEHSPMLFDAGTAQLELFVFDNGVCRLKSFNEPKLKINYVQ